MIENMIRHTLYEINLERKTAFCTQCGYVEIHIAKTRTRKTPKIICLNRFLEKSKARRKEQPLKRGRKPFHQLTNIDDTLLIAICSICGHTKITKRTRKGVIYYSCLTAQRFYMREYRLIHNGA